MNNLCSSDDNAFHGNTASDSDSSDLSLNKMELDIKVSDDVNLYYRNFMYTYVCIFEVN